MSGAAGRKRLGLGTVRAEAATDPVIAERQDLRDWLVPLVAVVDHHGVHRDPDVLDAEVQVGQVLKALPQ